MIQLTEERLTQLQTARGGFLYSTLRALGVEIVGSRISPWKHRVVNTWITDEQWARLHATVRPGNRGPTLFDRG